MQRFVGLGITASARFAISGFERSKSDERNFLVAGNSFDDGFHHLVDDLLSIFLCCACIFCNNVDQFSFIQGSPPHIENAIRDTEATLVFKSEGFHVTYLNLSIATIHLKNRFRSSPFSPFWATETCCITCNCR